MMNYDIIVIGGGHAGAEAAWAAAQMGCSVALITMRVDVIGRMSCNPAIGGLGKGHMVREIDALGGLMGLAADEGGIQFRTLNCRKGPAVRALRAQADQQLYMRAVQNLLRSVDGLDLIEGIVDGFAVEETAERQRARASGLHTTDNDTLSASQDDTLAPLRITGVRLEDGREFRAKAVVVTTGTFLRGLMHCGPRQTEGGRVGEPASCGLSDDLERLGIVLGRLKTGTPPRVHRDTIHFDRCTRQPGDDPPLPFSFMNDTITQPQIDCWITHTHERTHEIIRSNIHRAPMYSGQIKSRGPRYCPSIEDKVVRFADKPSHQIFLEPEGYDNPWIYCNGISTSLPEEVQEQLVHSIVGLEDARIVQHGYAVEYDWVPTDQIQTTLETKRVAGLFLAGQINGTSGYEEAAAQGLWAGVNAVAKIRGQEPMILGRHEAYIGVMIDDLVTRPPDEPYRMFTSRAEYRLHLRSDNADVRLTPIGRRMGLVDDARWDMFEGKRQAIDTLSATLSTRTYQGRPLSEWLRRPEVRLADFLAEMPDFDVNHMVPAVVEAVEINAKYAGYLEREQRLIDRARQAEARLIPESFDYSAIPTLRFEARERFAKFRPRSLGQAARISGISPSDIATLSIYLHQARASMP